MSDWLLHASDHGARASGDAVRAHGWAAWGVALGCGCRLLPLLVTGAPRTPLRALCIAAFDFAYRLRTSCWLPLPSRRRLARFLDYAADLNEQLDDKRRPAGERRRPTQRWESDEPRRLIAAIVRGWRNLEQRRPAPHGDSLTGEAVRLYREAVVQHALGALAALTLDLATVADGRDLVRSDPALQQAFRLAMLCQLIDDVLDYSADAQAGLPGFLTATPETGLAVTQARLAVDLYGHPSVAARFVRRGPLGAALVVLSLAAKGVLWGFGFTTRRSATQPAS